MKYIALPSETRAIGEKRLLDRLRDWIKRELDRLKVEYGNYQSARLLSLLAPAWKKAAERGGKRKHGNSDSEQFGSPFFPGEAVEARWMVDIQPKGSKRVVTCIDPANPDWYPGTVQGDGDGEGTCSILFDDGDVGPCVPYEHIRKRQ